MPSTPDQTQQATGLHTTSYYAASANRKDLRAPLTADLTADVCIVGAGFTGLSTAIALAEKGKKVVVLESQAIGFGASGRNGGQIVNGLNAELSRVERLFGADMAKFVGGLLQEGGDLIRSRIERYTIQCDHAPGNLFVATTKRHLNDLENKQKIWQKAGVDSLEMLDQVAVRDHVGSDMYVGGMIDRKGGHIHPLNLALGEADALESLGGKIFERSAALRIEKHGEGHICYTEHGSVTADQMVLCGNAYICGVRPELENRIMPVATQIVATEPLSAEKAKALLPTNICVEDTRYILDYYRMSADNRLLFGGGTVYGGTDPKDIRAKLYPNMIKVFPALAGTKLDFAWGGNFALSFSRVPQMGQTKDGIWYAHGYSGHGVTGSHLFGKILGEALTGDLSRYEKFAKLPYIPFPGGRALRVPYSTIGSMWYAMRDKLGI